MPTDLIWQDGKAVQVFKAWQIAGTNPKQVNSWESPDQLVAKPIETPTFESGRAAINLPPLSFTALITSMKVYP